MKSPLQTACERMTDPELAEFYALASDETRGPSARLCVIEGALEYEMNNRRLLPPVKTVSLTREPEKALATIIRAMRADQAAGVRMVDGAPCAMHSLDDPAFMAAARATCGANWLFGDQAIRAVRNLDEHFFTAAAEAVRVVERTRKGGRSPMLLHIRTALTILREGDRKGLAPQRKIEKQELRAELVKRLGDRAFSEKSESWAELFKRPELAPFVKQSRSGGRPKTSGRGRSWDGQ